MVVYIYPNRCRYIKKYYLDRQNDTLETESSGDSNSSANESNDSSDVSSQDAQLDWILLNL